MKKIGLILAAVVFVVGAGCATSGGSGSGSGSGPVSHGKGPYSFSQRELPARDMCRAWDMGKDAAAQVSREIACEEFMTNPPKSGWAVRRDGSTVFLNRFSDQGKVVESHVYDAFTAEYLGPATLPK